MARSRFGSTRPLVSLHALDHLHDQSNNDAVESGRPAPWIDALWQRALEAWDDEARHVALLDHALRAEALAEIAARYRSLLDDVEKGPRAKERLDAIVLAATSLLVSKKSPTPGRTPWPITLSAVGVCLFLLLWFAWALFPHR
jgi:hypothetical protein